MTTADERPVEPAVEDALRAYEQSEWGKATRTPSHARGLCMRASLVLLALLERGGVKATLRFLAQARDGSSFSPTDVHYVVDVEGEAIDVTARQFDPGGAAITRRRLSEVADPWGVNDL